MKDLVFMTKDDFFEYGFDEDGSVIVKTAIYIILEDTDGRRFSLNDSEITTIKMSEDEIYKIQENRIKNIQNHIDNGGRLDLNKWSEIDPVYGSEAYSNLDKVGYFKQREIEEENYKII